MNLTCPVINAVENTQSGSTLNSSYTAIFSLPALATKGFPVEVCGLAGMIGGLRGASGRIEVKFRIMRDATQVAEHTVIGDPLTEIMVPGAALRSLELDLAAGVYTYSLEAKVVTGTQATVNSVRLMARELERTLP